MLADLGRVIPLSFFVLVPFMEFALPFALRLGLGLGCGRASVGLGRRTAAQRVVRRHALVHVPLDPRQLEAWSG